MNETVKAVRDWAISQKPEDGIHGVSHWDRVRENGLLLAENCILEKNDILVIELFAYLHDICRNNDGADIEHGPRAARKIEEIRGSLLKELSDDDFINLQTAINLHTTKLKTLNLVVDICFDSDRLDLTRVGIFPEPIKLATSIARDIAVLRTSKFIKFEKGYQLDFSKESLYALRFVYKWNNGEYRSPYFGSFLWRKGKDRFTSSYNHGIFAIRAENFNPLTGLESDMLDKEKKFKKILCIVLEYHEKDIISEVKRQRGGFIELFHFTEIELAKANIIGEFEFSHPQKIDYEKIRHAICDFNLYKRKEGLIQSNIEKYNLLKSKIIERTKISDSEIKRTRKIHVEAVKKYGLVASRISELFSLCCLFKIEVIQDLLSDLNEIDDHLYRELIALLRLRAINFCGNGYFGGILSLYRKVIYEEKQ